MQFHYSNPDERIKRNELWMPYYSFVAEQMLGAHYTENKSAREMLQFLINEKALTAEDCVLDIGAGSGRYALEFAQLCKSVTAMDMNKASLAVVALGLAAWIIILMIKDPKGVFKKKFLKK